MYTNVHTAANAGGELRGQLVRSGEELFVAALSGVQEVPPVATTAGGAAQLLLDSDGRSARLAANTTATLSAAHIHSGMVGTNGPVAVAVTTAAPEMDQAIALTAEQAAELTAALSYFNVHTMAHPGGEVRGQFLRPGDTAWPARLTGAQEVPPVSGDATAAGMVVLRANESAIAYRVVHGIMPTGAHIHTAPGGANGPVAIGLTLPSAGAIVGSSAVTPAQVADLRAGRWYFNFHTATNPGGELRGQILRPGEVLFTAALSGANEVPPVTTAASGAFALVLNTLGAATFEGNFTGIPSAMAAHFHNAPAGMNGPVLYAIPLMGTSLVGVQPFTASDITALIAGNVYVNLHTATNPGGELRGQLRRQ
jgi:hypothetical protein